MRVAIVSQYYPPEIGATQNRLGAFATGLVARGHEVTVICEQPNHPSGVFRAGFGRWPLINERRHGITVRRVWVATSPHKTVARRLGFYTSFALGAAATLAAERRVDVVVASSPPLPGPLTAAAIARVRRIPFVLDVRDIWPAAAEALGELSDPRIVGMAERAEQWLYRVSACVTATTKPFCAHVDRVAGTAKSVHVPNGALDELLAEPVVAPSTDGPFVVGYTGNLGIAQGLQIVFDAAERLREENVLFVLVGAGPLANALRTERDRRRLSAIEFRPPMPVRELVGFMQGCHALLIPLRAHPLLAAFVPSKLYDAMAIGRPAIVAATGEAAALVEESGAGITVAPEDGQDLADGVLRMARDREWAQQLGDAGRRAAYARARSRQFDLLESLLQKAAVGAFSSTHCVPR